MHKVRVEWLSENEGGRKSAPPIGRYYSVSRFLEEDIFWQNNAWSVVFELEKPIMENGKFISEGYVQFLFDTAPQERMVKYNKFEIYEGPKKVADVFLIKD
ncbi:hypothetical protein JAF85_004833 [Citrobacter werkmanii]|uniref:hypothetical protein n=1 Tax=Citrobacter TaxID=544 RepID=UPI00076F0DB4|nr:MULTISPECIES: hypothetical protein [Citrobacter]GAS74956.1 hypothetical protein NGUA40_04604 [Salmonella enterica]EGT0638489.1 hypothetical protein [Citrobacter werkmanii]EGT0674013.1 hypothetical protein [Citrobacter werkmanii]MDT0638164.1 hypothetical protein [Citrobacter werkmanii]TKU70790.1 hypothetical protein FDX14_18290 [Citrobacter sp. wls710]